MLPLWHEKQHRAAALALRRAARVPEPCSSLDPHTVGTSTAGAGLRPRSACGPPRVWAPARNRALCGARRWLRLVLSHTCMSCHVADTPATARPRKISFSIPRFLQQLRLQVAWRLLFPGLQPSPPPTRAPFRARKTGVVADEMRPQLASWPRSEATKRNL